MLEGALRVFRQCFFEDKPIIGRRDGLIGATGILRQCFLVKILTEVGGRVMSGSGNLDSHVKSVAS